jgi:hypothetical protein
MTSLLKVAFAFLLVTSLLAPRVSGETAGPTLIVGDGSGSMQGFANAGATRLSALFQLLFRNNDSAQLSILTSDGETKATRIANVPQSNFFASPANYHGGTDLIYALQYIHQNTTQAVLVTDGMQSEGMYLKVKEKLKQIANDGWGLWLFAIKLPFDGVYDPEQALNVAEAQPMIEQCIRTDDENARISLKKTNSNRYFNYKGIRPILILVLSKNADTGRQLAQKISENLNADPQLPARVVELAPLVYRGVGFAKLEAASDYVRIDNAADKIVIRSDTVDGQRTKEVNAPIVWLNPLPVINQAYEEVPRWNGDQPSWIEEELNVINDDADPEALGKIKVRFISELPWLRSTFCFLPLVSCTSEKPDLLNLTVWTEFAKSKSPWWEDMNTDTSWRCPSRVYKLTELTKDLGDLSVARYTVAHPPKIKALQLIVGPL